MSFLSSLAYMRDAITVRNVDFTVLHFSTCIVSVNFVSYILNLPFIILHLQIFRIMEGVCVPSSVGINSGNLHVLSRLDYVRVCMHVCLSSSFCFFSSHLPSLLRGGEVHLLQVRERKTRTWKRKGNAHTQRAGRRGRMNLHTSHAALLRRRYAHYRNSHANGRRMSTENTNDNSSTSTRRRSIRLAAEATAGAGGRGGGGGVDARGITVHL